MDFSNCSLLSFRDALKNKIETVRFLTEGKEALTVEVEQLKTKCKTMQEDLDNAVKAKEGLERDSEALQRFLVIFI